MGVGKHYIQAMADGDDRMGPRLALVIGISEYENFSNLPGALKDAMLAEQTLKQLGFYTKCLSGNVRKQALIDSIDDWLLQVEQEAKNHQNPLVAVVYSGHGIKPERSEFPVLLSSDDLFEAPDCDVTVGGRDWLEGSTAFIHVIGVASRSS